MFEILTQIITFVLYNATELVVFVQTIVICYIWVRLSRLEWILKNEGEIKYERKTRQIMGSLRKVFIEDETRGSNEASGIQSSRDTGTGGRRPRDRVLAQSDIQRLEEILKKGPPVQKFRP